MNVRLRRTIVRLTPARLAAVAAGVAVAAAGTVIGLAVPSSAGAGGAAATGQPAAISSSAPAVVLPAGVPTTVSPQATPAPLTVEVATSPDYGPVLVTPAGMTLYRQSGTCSSSCAAPYHPLLLPAGQQLHKPPLLHGQLGTVPLPDGSRQVSYDGWPLFLYSGDRYPGDTNGVSLSWQVIQPAS